MPITGRATLPRDGLARRSTQESEYCKVLESKIELLESVRSTDRPVAPLGQSSSEFTHVAGELTTCASTENGDLAAQLESYRRLPVLLEHLDAALSKIAV